MPKNPKCLAEPALTHSLNIFMIFFPPPRCVICMMDFVYGDPIRFLPCMHIYHLDCIDDWLMRSFTYHPL
uniref:RING-type domain-containing protein n=1 Tax=Bubo bubo TaxID=30461 RepID=A0A8C0ENJ2_BUBBB